MFSSAYIGTAPIASWFGSQSALVSPVFLGIDSKGVCHLVINMSMFLEFWCVAGRVFPRDRSVFMVASPCLLRERLAVSAEGRTLVGFSARPDELYVSVAVYFCCHARLNLSIFMGF